MTSKEKLDSLLGISEGKSLDDFLDSLSVEEGSAKDALDKIDKEMKSTVKEIDMKINPVDLPKQTSNIHKPEETLLQTTNDVSLSDLKNLEKNFEEIKNLVDITKNIIAHLYNNVVSTDLIDTELVNSTATLIEIAHRNIKEYIELYRDRMKFYDKIRLEYIQHEHKKELIALKHSNDLERISKAAENKPMEVVPENMVAFSQEEVIKTLASETI